MCHNTGAMTLDKALRANWRVKTKEGLYRGLLLEERQRRDRTRGTGQEAPFFFQGNRTLNKPALLYGIAGTPSAGQRKKKKGEVYSHVPPRSPMLQRGYMARPAIPFTVLLHCSMSSDVQAKAPPGTAVGILRRRKLGKQAQYF